MTDPRLQDLSELPRRMTATLDVNALSEELTLRAIEGTGAVVGAIAVWDKPNDRLVTLADIETIDLGMAVPPGETYALLDDYPAARYVLTERRAISIQVDRADDDAAERDWLREHGLSASLLLPLVSRGEAIGQMCLARREGSFDADDLVYCQLLSDIAGSAIENARLYGELQSTLTQYRSLIERLPAVTYLDDLETGETRYISPQITHLFGITPEEWMSSPDAWLRALHPDDRDRVAATFNDSVQAGEPFHAEYRVVSADGAVRWVMDRTEILPRVDGQPPLTQGMIFDITDRKRAEQELSHRASHDPLTGLPNREEFRVALDEAIASAEMNDTAVAVMYVDLDDFKLVNDGFGHEVGDELLAGVAERLRRATRATDVVGRDGGDEFLVLMPGLPAGPEDAARVAQMATTRVRDALIEPVSTGSVDLYVSTSIGVSLFPFDASDSQTLLKHADAAMYAAKAAGRDGCRFFEPGSRDSEERLALTGRLRHAIKHGELELHYQPIVELASGRMVRVEALSRWIDAERGRIGPDEFIPLAEQTGLIRPLTEWAIREASRQAAEWAAAGYASHVAVNIPPDTCQRIGAGSIAVMIRSEGCDPSRITFEMTESATMAPRPGLEEQLAILTAHGMSLAIDDFGTGHSSLGRLGDFPAEMLKIDRSFVRGLPDDRAARTLVKAIMDLAEGFGMTVVAEGVETESHRDFLLAAGCKYAQGYLFSPPLPATEVAALWPAASAPSSGALDAIAS